MTANVWALDGAYVPFFGAFGAAWDDAMVARGSASPLGMLWPEMDAAFVASGSGNGGPPPVAWRPAVIIAAGQNLDIDFAAVIGWCMASEELRGAAGCVYGAGSLDRLERPRVGEAPDILKKLRSRLESGD